VQATDGNFYGITYAGGANNDSVVFKMTRPPTATVTVLHTFDGTDGANSYGPLIQAINGILYGVTAFGGANQCNLHGMLVGCGTIFKVTLAGSLTTLHNFNGSDGAFPSVGLIQAADGNFYGTTYQGGAGGNCSGGCGTIFKFVLNPQGTGGALTTLHTFGAPADPNALLQATNGEFYGTTIFGGTNNDGTVFSLSVGLGPFIETLPTSGKVGTAVIILGNDLTGTTKVTFNGTKATFTVSSTGTAIKTTVPSGATTGKVKVTTPTRTLISNVNFRVTPTVSGFSPTSGPPGTSVVINGDSFITGATSVTFAGGVKGTITSLTYTKITVTVPAGAKTGKISVTTPGGTATSSGTFTVT
jgi:uncharacterized repeat protein (TIGR03803 family)